MERKRLFPIYFFLIFLVVAFSVFFLRNISLEENRNCSWGEILLNKKSCKNFPLRNNQDSYQKSEVPPVVANSVIQNENKNENENQKKEKTVIKKKCSGQDTCTAKVVSVVDGDTINLETGEKVRYVGINTPEIHHPYKKVECFGKEASEKNKEFVQEKEVVLVRDVSDKDKYGRLLRFVFVGDLFVNEFLVKNGYASVSTFPPDVKNKKLFQEAENFARENQLGFWQKGVCN